MGSRLVGVLLLLVGCAHAPVMTDRGPVLGARAGGLQIFKGIPYAAPPIGALRWKAPEPAPSWKEVRDATRAGPACVQPVTGGIDRLVSEDCLTLNIWSPDGAERLPVMVWIHGGGFYSGSGTDPLYDAAKLAVTARAVVVTLNYRLGALGFLAHPETGTASVGLLDQQLALRWVQHNIAALGGDPTNVTLFGESAGAWSTCAHLAMPQSRGLFARAIMQSGACSDALYFSPAAALAQGTLLARALGCDSLQCMQGKKAGEVVAALPMKRSMLLPPGVWWGPVIDGKVLPEVPLEALRGGRANEVPLLLGWNRDEGVLHTIGLTEVTDDDIAGFVRDHFGEAAAAQMPARSVAATKHLALDDIVTEGVFACGARRVANALSARDVPVFVYELTHALDDEGPHRLGPTHTVELFFVFGNEDQITLSAREKIFSETVMRAWGQFARDGAPGGAWPRWTRAEERYLELDLQPVATAHPRQGRCDAWDAVERGGPW